MGMGTVLQEAELEQFFETFQRQLEGKLKEQIIQGNPVFEDFQKTYQGLQKLQRDFQSMLQWAAEDQRGKEEERRFWGLYRQVAGWNASQLMDGLKKTGYACRRDSDLKETFDRQGYRILELVRAGKRDEVFYSILRIFVSAKKDFPPLLAEAFKPIYSGELFKVLLFSFLSGVLGKEEDE